MPPGRDTVRAGGLTVARRDLYRQRILAAAEYEFAVSGFDETKVTGIAATANLSLATLYKNFVGKDEIWNALNAQRMNELVGTVREATTDSLTPLAAIQDGLRAQVAFFADHRNFLHLHIKEGWNWATATESGRGGQRKVWQDGVEMMTRVVERGSAAGELVPIKPRLMARLVISALQVFLTEWVDEGAIQSPEEMAQQLIDHVVSALAHTPSTSS